MSSQSRFFVVAETSLQIEIRLREQRLFLKRGTESVASYVVSTAKNGAGEQYGSERTPRGRHVIAEKIGADQPANTVFIGRRPTGEQYSDHLRNGSPERDWILTRILWLSGCEAGFNQGGDVDSKSRHIYIHGAPDDVDMSVRGSHGCIRMYNRDVVDLFQRVEVGTSVLILED